MAIHVSSDSTARVVEEPGKAGANRARRLLIRNQRWIARALWIVSAVVAMAVCWQRYLAAVAHIGYDFSTYFLPAGHLVREGSSPYLQDGYVYSVIPAALVALVAGTENPVAWWAVINVGAGLVTIGLIIAALWEDLRTWQRPLVFGGTAVALMYNKTTTLMLFLGQTELLVMMGIALAALAARRGWAATSGLGIAWAGLIKTWPMATGLWLLRRDAPHRLRSILAAASAVAVTLLVTMVAFGTSAVTGWIGNVMGQTSQPRLIHYSVLHLGSRLFTDQAGPLVPLAHSPVLAVAVDVAATASVVALLLWCLLHPGDDALCLWHVTALVVLLLPVSHSFYLLYLIPLPVIWTARALAGPHRRRSVPVVAGWAAWWLLIARAQWDGDMNTRMSTSAYIVIMAATLAMITWSVIAESVRVRRQSAASYARPTRGRNGLLI